MKQTKRLLILLLLNLLIYIERGLIPGSSDAITTFLKRVLNTDKPSFYFGLLQSLFVGGLSVASLIFAHSTHYLKFSILIIIGMSIWILAAFMTGTAIYLRGSQFVFLIIARILSGAGEASIISLAPPLILRKTTGVATGIWMGVFSAVIPIGVALGFVFGGYITNFFAWNISFYIMGSITIPGVFFLLLFPHYIDDTDHVSANNINLNNHSYEVTDRDDISLSKQHEEKELVRIDQNQIKSDNQTSQNNVVVDGQNLVSPSVPTAYNTWQNLLTDVLILAKSPIFILLAFATAAYTAVVSIFSTFGVSYLLAFEFVATEFNASLLMGIISATSGLFGGLAGGGLSALSTRNQKQFSINKHTEVNSCQTAIIDGVNSDLTLQVQSENTKDSTSETIMSTEAFVSGFESIVKKYANFVLVQQLLLHLIPIVMIGLISLPLTSVSYSSTNFIFFLFIGLFAVFMAQSNINLSIMLIVPSAQQSFAIAANTVALHIFGDVPAPAIAGFIKDKLAPACSTLDEITRNVNKNCKNQTNMLRLSLKIFTLWLIWMVVTIIAAYIYSRRKTRSLKAQVPVELLPIN